jgi:hypothetical protein
MVGVCGRGMRGLGGESRAREEPFSPVPTVVPGRRKGRTVVDIFRTEG